MTTLLLVRGDPKARKILQKAIQARFGLRPVALDSISLTLQRTSRVRFGLPVKTLVKLDLDGQTRLDWHATTKIFGFSLANHRDCFQNDAYKITNNGHATTVNNPRMIDSIRQLLWGNLASLLTPLTGSEVTLKVIDDISFQAAPTNYPEDVATVTLNDDDTVKSVVINRYRYEDERIIPFEIAPLGGLQLLNTLAVPKQISYGWQDQTPEVYDIIGAQALNGS